MFKTIQEQVYYLYKEKKQPLLLAIDEAQYLNNILQKPVHEALRQRITVHYNYTGLTDNEVSAYILHKLHCAGGAPSIIQESALGAVHGYCQGNPRIIDNLMTDAFSIGAQMDKKSVDTEVILSAVNNQQLI